MQVWDGLNLTVRELNVSFHEHRIILLGSCSMRPVRKSIGYIFCNFKPRKMSRIDLQISVFFSAIIRGSKLGLHIPQIESPNFANLRKCQLQLLRKTILIEACFTSTNSCTAAFFFKYRPNDRRFNTVVSLSVITVNLC